MRCRPGGQPRRPGGCAAFVSATHLLPLRHLLLKELELFQQSHSIRLRQHAAAAAAAAAAVGGLQGKGVAGRPANNSSRVGAGLGSGQGGVGWVGLTSSAGVRW